MTVTKRLLPASMKTERALAMQRFASAYRFGKVLAAVFSAPSFLV
jgi:hypothetical protein